MNALADAEDREHLRVEVRTNVKRDPQMSKETYYGRKRDLLWKEKRPTMEGKETYYGRKRDLLWKEKRPTMEGKETYYERQKE